MIPSLIVGCALLAVSEDVTPPRPTDNDLKTYAAARAQARRDPEAHYKLALWCEAHGLTPERLKHLAMTILIDPNHVAARGLLGFVKDGGRWRKASDVADRARADEELARKLSEYHKRRDSYEASETEWKAFLNKLKRPLLTAQGRRPEREPGPSALGHLELGLWCEQNGLGPEAKVHFSEARRLDPKLTEAWHHLGFQKVHGRWATPEQIAAEHAEAAAQKAADHHWLPHLRRLRGLVRQKGKTKEEAEAALDDVTDPRSVASIWKVFAHGDDEDQRYAIRMYARIPSPLSTRALAFLTVFASSDKVAQAATDVLEAREPRDFVGDLVDLIHTPLTFMAQPVQGPGTSGTLVVDGPRFHLIRHYNAPPPFQLGPSFWGYAGYDVNGMPVVAEHVELKYGPYTLQDLEARTIEMFVEARIKAVRAETVLERDILEIQSCNQIAAIVNPRIAEILRRLYGAADLKDDEDAWHRWWYDRIGYRYTSAPKVDIEDSIPQLPAPYLTTCFAAGTPVLTREGRKPIEAIRVGDVVLSQDAATGALRYQPVIGLHHNAPDETLTVRLGDETLVASVYHRFWRPGKGWAMARELQPGDVVRTLAGLLRVGSVGHGDRVPLYNLDVTGPATFFVGTAGALVHDNTLPDPHLKPFDAAPNLAP